jgi:EAL domain-containing protein (putative c-di-GMP-specific phosphodiesterase class I)
MPTPALNLGEIVSAESLTALYQPIVSLKKKNIAGYEGLIRGLPIGGGEIIPPQKLFVRASETGLTLELDRLCRKKVLAGFNPRAAGKPGGFLSLNFESSVIDQGVVGSGALLRQVTDAELEPSSISLEIIESHVKDLRELQKFIQIHRDYGFLIALDDVGAGHSNLNRIPLLKPDLLKVDRYLVQHIHLEFHKQEVFKSLVGLAHKIGALTLAEGIETEEEAQTVMELGVDLIQGFYFSKPHRLEEIDTPTVSARIAEINEKYKDSLFQKMKIKRYNLKKYEVMTREVQIELTKISPANFTRKLEELIHYFPLVESLYVLDEKGIQATDTVFGKSEEGRRNHHMFRPAHVGEDHTMKDYFYMLIDGGLRKTTYVTEPYLSLSTGNMCVTFARLFHNGTGGPAYVLCADVNTEYLQKISMGLYN